MRKALEASDVRVVTDTRANYTPGWKYNHWELKGLPLRCELGPKDMENSCVVLARRDTGGYRVIGAPGSMPRGEAHGVRSEDLGPVR